LTWWPGKLFASQHIATTKNVDRVVRHVLAYDSSEAQGVG